MRSEVVGIISYIVSKPPSFFLASDLLFSLFAFFPYEKPFLLFLLFLLLSAWSGGMHSFPRLFFLLLLAYIRSSKIN